MSITPDMRRWLDEKEVSRLTMLSLSTLRAHRFYRKGIPYSKVGRSVRYSVTDVTTFIDSRRITIENTELVRSLCWMQGIPL